MNTKELIKRAELLPDEETDKKWVEVAQKRLDEMRSGSVTPVPGKEVFAKIWAGFDASPSGTGLLERPYYIAGNNIRHAELLSYQAEDGKM